MSLSAWEQQTLDSIKDGLVGSDPSWPGCSPRSPSWPRGRRCRSRRRSWAVHDGRLRAHTGNRGTAAGPVAAAARARSLGRWVPSGSCFFCCS